MIWRRLTGTWSNSANFWVKPSSRIRPIPCRAWFWPEACWKNSTAPKRWRSAGPRPHGAGSGGSNPCGNHRGVRDAGCGAQGQGRRDRGDCGIAPRLELNPDNAIVRRDLIQSLLENKDQRAALEALDAAIVANPTLAVWHEMRGDLLLVTFRSSSRPWPRTTGHMRLRPPCRCCSNSPACCSTPRSPIAVRQRSGWRLADDMKTEAVLATHACACLPLSAR